MRRRGITLDEMEEALASAATTYPSREFPDERTVVLGTTAKGRPLKIVITVADPECVVTVADRSNQE